MNEDSIYTNNYYAQVAGISLKKLNKIEHEFLNMNKFKLFVDKNLFNKYQQYLSNFYLNTKYLDNRLMKYVSYVNLFIL